jgi:nucleotide-binding universal stress UspA family protein
LKGSTAGLPHAFLQGIRATARRQLHPNLERFIVRAGTGLFLDSPDSSDYAKRLWETNKRCRTNSSKILIPVDGSPASLRAVDFAVQKLVRGEGDLLLLLHVQNLGSIDMAGFSAAIPDFVSETASQVSAKALQDAVGKCEEAHVAFQSIARAGPIALTIAEVARVEGVGQIVMGTRGLGGVQGLLLGSVATQVIHLVEVPITLIK